MRPRYRSNPAAGAFLRSANPEVSMGRSKSAAIGSAVALIAVLSGCGGGSTSVATPVPQAAIVPYSQAVVLGSLAPHAAGLIDAQGITGAQIVSATASALLAPGITPVVAVHRSTNAAGALIACISAPTSSTGTVDGINLGVNIKSIAALMDSTWALANDQSAAWVGLTAGKSVFEGWENCGAKPEGLPSPASLRVINADGGFSDDVYDGNPSTNLNIIRLHVNPASVAQMLTTQGYLDSTQINAAKRIWLRVYRNNLAQLVLVEQGLPEAGSSATVPGYLAVYFTR